MDSIEIIEIRVAQNLRVDFEFEIEKLIVDLQRGKNEFSLNFYSHRQHKSDYLLLIFHGEQIPDHRGSAIGHRLVEAFREYGVINRSVWNAIATEYNITS